MNTARKEFGGAGTQTAALAFGGRFPPGDTALTEQYDGTSWTEVNDLNTARRNLGGAGDRKSTRLNSSHGYISYAVFCLKKKNKKEKKKKQKQTKKKKNKLYQ